MNIPTSLIVVGLVVAWLVVLVPMVARRRERVPQEPASGGGHAGATPGLGLAAPQAAPCANGAGARPRSTIWRTEEVLVSVGAGPQHEPTDAAEEWAAAQAESGRSVATMAPAHDEPQQLSFTDEDRGLGDSGSHDSGVDVPAAADPRSGGSGFVPGAESVDSAETPKALLAGDVSGADGCRRRWRAARRPRHHPGRGRRGRVGDGGCGGADGSAVPVRRRRRASISVRCPGGPVAAATTRRPRRRPVPTGTGNGGGSPSCC